MAKLPGFPMMDEYLKELSRPKLLFARFLQPGGRCPHCSIPNPGYEQAWFSSAPIQRATPGQTAKWGTYFRMSCGGGILARGIWSDLKETGEIAVLIPAGRLVHDDVPEPVRIFLQQAIDTQHAPDAAALMAGSAVDAMLKTLGYEKGSVYTRINTAVADHKITESMGEWAHAVRLEANNPRHADKEKPHVSSDEASQSVEFAEALAFFLFVLTERIKRGKKAAEAASAPPHTEAPSPGSPNIP
ncbi:DUF4145 domain-containing protein [Mesorhizobium neociceri]|uniref:DUF4145 domain-containing protein n=1 Tax=Mesorhizobium neociceri TaxID=1307853 RepID=A0A838B1L8_9HYPH|nr:DUF4145 domain-containing protein [Mesorhizobium neociceri]MBA1140275.1 DUF4145 domain-containing protein [Mesorhizobium neociceri]